jgi:phage shock protein PspC (stress-responsive transcriptional regulator)
MARLTRPARGQGRMVVGVAAAVSDGLGLPVGLVRLVFVLTALFGLGELVYLVLWVLLPNRPAGW